MTSLELAICLGEIPDEYIMEARQTAQRENQSIRKIWLIAAVIALAALLVGGVCAAAGEPSDWPGRNPAASGGD